MLCCSVLKAIDFGEEEMRRRKKLFRDLTNCVVSVLFFVFPTVKSAVVVTISDHHRCQVQVAHRKVSRGAVSRPR